MSIGDLAEVTVHLDFGGADKFANVFGFKAIHANATLTNLATAFQTAVIKNTSGGLLNGTRAPYGSASLTARDVSPGTVALVEHTYTRVEGNVVTGTLGSLTNAICLKWTSSVSGRSYRGRSYLTGWPSAEAVAGAWLSTPIAAVNAFKTQMLAVFGPSGSDTNWQFVVISRFFNNAPRIPPIGTAIVAGLPDLTIRQQRRRELGVGS